MKMKKCKFKGCNRDHAAKGYCRTHYMQFRKGKQLAKIKKVVTGRVECTVYGCLRPHRAKGLCNAHWQQQSKGKSLTQIRGVVKGRVGCKVCNKEHFAKGYCQRHYNQKYHIGCIRKRFITDPNEFIEKENHYEIILYYMDGTRRKERGIIDKDDYQECKNIKWGISGKRCQYIRNSKYGNLEHHVWGKKVLLDHINRNKLDCRKLNLREATPQQNSFNRSMISRNTSGITGVRWSQRLQKWRAQISVNGKNKHLGLFPDINNAKEAYNKAVIKYRGQFGRINQCQHSSKQPVR